MLLDYNSDSLNASKIVFKVKCSFRNFEAKNFLLGTLHIPTTKYSLCPCIQQMTIWGSLGKLICKKDKVHNRHFLTSAIFLQGK